MTKDNKPAIKGTTIAIIIGSIVIVALAITVVVLLVKNNSKPKEEEKRSVVVTEKNVDAVVDQMASAEYIEPGYYEASMTNTWHYANGEATSDDAYVENKAENTNDVYFDVFLAEDEEHPIIQSPVIPRGVEYENIPLDTPLDAGTYDCVLIYHLIDEDQNTVSTLRVGITIIVEN